MIDHAALEAFLIDAAQRREPVTYSAILAHFAKPVGPVMVRALMADLGHVCRRLEPLGLRDIACLVVRKSDGLPGAGYFAYLRDEEGYNGPAEGVFAQTEIARRQERIFAIAADVEIMSCGE